MCVFTTQSPAAFLNCLCQEWDLNTGQVVNRFDSHTSQISTVAFRPIPPTPLYDTKDSETDKPDDEPVDLGESLADPPAAEGQDQPLEKSDEGMKVDETPAAAPQKTPKSPGDGFDPLFDEDDASGSDAAGSPDDVYVEPAAAKKPNGSGPPKPPATGVAALPPVTDASLPALSPDVFLGSAIDGQTLLWDRRIKGTGNGYVRRLPISPGASPWATSAAWSTDGNAVFVGRRNTCVDVYDLRQVRPDPAAAAQRTIRLPLMSGPVSCVLPWPDGKNLVCGSFDNIRLYNLQAEADGAKVPFRIIPGHSTGTISQMCTWSSLVWYATLKILFRRRHAVSTLLRDGFGGPRVGCSLHRCRRAARDSQSIDPLSSGGPRVLLCTFIEFRTRPNTSK